MAAPTLAYDSVSLNLATQTDNNQILPALALAAYANDTAFKKTFFCDYLLGTARKDTSGKTINNVIGCVIEGSDNYAHHAAKRHSRARRVQLVNGKQETAIVLNDSGLNTTGHCEIIAVDSWTVGEVKVRIRWSSAYYDVTKKRTVNFRDNKSAPWKTGDTLTTQLAMGKDGSPEERVHTLFIDPEVNTETMNQLGYWEIQCSIENDEGTYTQPQTISGYLKFNSLEVKVGSSPENAYKSTTKTTVWFNFPTSYLDFPSLFLNERSLLVDQGGHYDRMPEGYYMFERNGRHYYFRQSGDLTNRRIIEYAWYDPSTVTPDPGRIEFPYVTLIGKDMYHRSEVIDMMKRNNYPPNGSGKLYASRAEPTKWYTNTTLTTKAGTLFYCGQPTSYSFDLLDLTNGEGSVETINF